MPTILEPDQQALAAARERGRRSRRLLAVLVGVALAILGLALHRPAVTFAGVVFVLLASALGGGT
jgi:Na+/H+ antiporter NhaB